MFAFFAEQAPLQQRIYFITLESYIGRTYFNIQKIIRNKWRKTFP